MRLYLSSFDLGHAAAVFFEMTRGARVGLVMNALDNRPEGRAHWLADQSAKLTDLGFETSELDLRDYFDDSATLKPRLATLDAVWINGGNAFLLRRAMAASGFDRAIKTALARDEIAYGGFSAGAVVTAPSLRGLEIIDDPHDVLEGYPPEVPWDGLGLLPFSIVVHAASDHPESKGAAEEAAFYECEGIPFITLRDGEAYVVRGQTKGQESSD